MKTIWTRTSLVHNGKTYVGGNYEYYDREDITCHNDWQKLLRLSEYRAIKNLMSKIKTEENGER